MKEDLMRRNLFLQFTIQGNIPQGSLLHSLESFELGKCSHRLFQGLG